VDARISIAFSKGVLLWVHSFVLDSHYIVPELGPGTKFSVSSKKVVSEYKEAKEVMHFLCLTYSGFCVYLCKRSSSNGLRTCCLLWQLYK
jgi:hypothetical protein